MRRIAVWLTVAAACATLAASGPGTSGAVVAAPEQRARDAKDKHGKKPYVDDRVIAHALNRMAFGPAPGDVARVRDMGLERYVEEQLHPERLSDDRLRDRLARFETLQLSSREIAERFYVPLEAFQRQVRQRQASENRMEAAEPPTSEERAQVRDLREQSQRILAELSQQKLLRAVYSERQLEEVLVDFWFNHFNVFANKGPTRTYVTAYERDVIRPHVFGTFRDLLGATAHSPAMLFYLDNWQSTNPDGPGPAGIRRPTAANTVGQRPRLQGISEAELGERRARQREQRAKREQEQRERERAERMADAQTPDARMAAPPPRPVRGLNENYARELLELHTLGVDGGYTQQDIIQVAHAFTGWTIQEPQRGGDFRFDERRHTPGPKKVLGKTIDKGGEADGEAVLDLLAKHPSTAKFIATKLARRLVADEPPAKLVDRAAATFRSTDGDLRAVVRTILTSPEFVAPQALRAKVKSPLEFVASALRATGAQIDDGMVLVRNLQNMGMPLYLALAPTGYRDRAEAWINTGALLNRMNFAMALVNNRLRGVRIDLTPLTGSAGATDVAAARDGLLAALLSNDVSETTRATIAKGNQVTQVAALTLGSPEFQRR